MVQKRIMRERLGIDQSTTDNELRTKARFRLCEANDVSKIDYDSDDSWYERERIKGQIEERRRTMIVNLHKKMGMLAKLIDAKRFNALRKLYPNAYECDTKLNPPCEPEPQPDLP
jgi:hypothetical protein